VIGPGACQVGANSKPCRRTNAGHAGGALAT
jgi:hypothetical protein